TPIIQRFQMLDRRGEASGQIGMGEELVFALHLLLPRRLPGLVVSIHLYNSVGQRVTTCHTGFQHRGSIDHCGHVMVRCCVPHLVLMAGVYYVTVGVAFDGGMLDRIDPVTSLEILPRDVFSTGRLPLPRDGLFFCPGTWEFDALQPGDDLVDANRGCLA